MLIEFYSNMNSGKNLRDRWRIHKFRKIVGDNGQVFATKSEDQLELIVEDMHKRRPKCAILDTGDGGLCKFISLLVKYWPASEEMPSIALVDGSTFGVVAKQCNVPKKRKDVKKYIEQIIADEGIYRQNIDFIKVRDNNGIETYGFSFGVGTVVTLLEEVYKRKTWKMARVGLILARLRFSKMFREQYYALFNQKTNFNVQVNVDGQIQSYDDEYLAIMAQTIKSIGLRGSETFYRAQERTGYFHVRGVAEELKEVMRLKNMARIYSGLPFGKLDEQTDITTISSEEPFPYQMNGDLEFRTNGHIIPYLANRVTIEHGKTFQFLKAAI